MSDQRIGVDASTWNGPYMMKELFDYWIDAGQRTILMLDAMYQRAGQYEEHAAKNAPHVLKFSFYPVLDGRKLPKPSNYVLVRIDSQKHAEVDDNRRPVIVVDPRAGHGPGIGGFKSDSEIGVALNAGHPCYLVGFLPEPVPGQTIEDTVHTMLAFIEHVISLHPHSIGKPTLIANCQAGWAIMMAASIRPQLFGPIILAGSPLSYWAGVRGRNPLRYLGGLLGGSWLTAMAGDISAGKFDGAWLVTNFESLNPSNTLWTKQYNLYSKIDTEVPRYLEFEQWWGGHVVLNAEEMQFIADKLFIGNRLASSDITFDSGENIDLRNIKSPILVFCSKSDNITPPQQALDWITDLYSSIEEVRAREQTIVYAVHDTVGHLGIFVSSAIAKKEHNEFVSNSDLIDVLPPGLYEAVMVPKDPADPSADLISGSYLLRFESRTLDDIRAMGGNDEEDDRKFATAARISEITLGLYKTCFQPWIRIWANDGASRWLQKTHPARLQYQVLSDKNPFVNALHALVPTVKQNRRAVDDGNPFWQLQETYSEWIKAWLDMYRDVRDHQMEEWFHAIYGAPLLQALVGLNGSEGPVRRRPIDDMDYRKALQQRIDELKAGISRGDAREAMMRSLIYVRMADGAVDERSLALLRQMRDEAGQGLSLAEFKQLVREQYFMLLLDERRAVAAIPRMISRDTELAPRMRHKFKRIIEVLGVKTEMGKARLREVETALDTLPCETSDEALLELQPSRTH
ncbi:MAG: DUF3141 domain-containing protein [Hyphomicrobiaceae bacterium]